MKIVKTIQKQKSKKYAKRTLTIFALLTLLGLVVFLVLNNRILFNKKTDTIDTTYNPNPPTTEQIQAGEEIKKNDNENTNNDLVLNFISINQSDSILYIRTAVNSAITNDGICTLKLQRNDQIYKFTKPTFALTSYSTCQGFDIDTSEYTKGQWEATLTVEVDEKTSSINQIITLE